MTEIPEEDVGCTRALLALGFVGTFAVLLGTLLAWPADHRSPVFVSQRGLDGPVDESGQGPIDSPEEAARKIKEDEAAQRELLERRVRELTHPPAPSGN